MVSYEERCETLHWSTLEPRREYFSLVECFNIVIELNGPEFCDFSEHCNNNTRYKSFQNTFDVHKGKRSQIFFFSFVRINKEWNNLGRPFLEMTLTFTLKKFKYNLEKWMNVS